MDVPRDTGQGTFIPGDAVVERFLPAELFVPGKMNRLR